MRIIAFETATARASIALVDDSAGVIGERDFEARGRLSTLLLPALADLEKDAWPVTAADLLVTAGGPGSFTGLRVAMAVVKGLAFAAGLPVVAANSLAAAAIGAGRPGRILAVFDARSGFYYVAGYYVQADEVRESQAPVLISNNELISFESDWYAGPPPKPEGIPAAQWLDVWPRAGVLARLGAKTFLAHGAEDLVTLKPHYLKRGQV